MTPLKGDNHKELYFMSQVQGTVFKVYENNKFKNPLYSIKIDGDDTYYGSGNVKPACAAGDVVTFDFVINNKGYHQLVPDSLKVVSKSATTSAPANLKSTGGGMLVKSIGKIKMLMMHVWKPSIAIAQLATKP